MVTDGGLVVAGCDGDVVVMVMVVMVAGDPMVGVICGVMMVPYGPHG